MAPAIPASRTPPLHGAVGRLRISLDRVGPLDSSLRGAAKDAHHQSLCFTPSAVACFAPGAPAACHLAEQWQCVPGATGDRLLAGTSSSRRRSMPSARVPTFTANANGRDFVVGDVHGCFRTLERALTELKFDPACDRLFGVGDLVNRGPNSNEAVDWLEQRFTRPSRSAITTARRWTGSTRSSADRGQRPTTGKLRWTHPTIRAGAPRYCKCLSR